MPRARLSSATSSTYTPLPPERSSRAILEKLRERVNQAAKGTWVVGQGAFGTQVPPTAAELTAAFPEHPVVVKYGMHQYVANRKALEMAGINKLTPDPPGAKIERPGRRTNRHNV
jgi:predicted amidohydrolase YtcJ